MLILALIMNITIIVFEIFTLGHIRGKLNILKYYTYLQNFIALIISLIFSIGLIVCIISDVVFPEFIKGLRYIATCGLLVTTFIFVVFLGAGKKIKITEDDFMPGCSPKTANILLHYVCPILSLISFVFFERNIDLTNDIWTAIVAAPSCIYWTIYLVLSLTNLWEEPYNFASQENNNNIRDILSIILIPVSFIAISFIVWNIM